MCLYQRIKEATDKENKIVCFEKKPQQVNVII